MPRVVHFEIHAEDPERAVTYYKTLFDWQFHRWEGPMDHWLVYHLTRRSTGDQRRANAAAGRDRWTGCDCVYLYG